eukprot:4824885-Pleurochrysis_carterae.AAC.1
MPETRPPSPSCASHARRTRLLCACAHVSHQHPPPFSSIRRASCFTRRAASAAPCVCVHASRSFLDYPKPIFAAVNGPAVGAPVTSATLCDGAAT